MERERLLKKIIDGDGATALEWNQNVDIRRSRRFLLLLYARYVCFRVFLQCAAQMDGGITKNHKGRWLLIQLAPATLLAQSDIFVTFTRMAETASGEYLNQAIYKESATVQDLLPPCTGLFCVLDEAQALTKNLDCLPIILKWRWKSLNLIISGTGIPMREVETDTRSMVAKEGGGPIMVTEISGFDDEDGRRAYLKQYFPPGFLDTSEGEEIASRVGYWLRGRFVFNAAV